ncbi:hypothetical protein FisN_3Lh166 [Fistulifera solaris]|uniref:Helicase-associated domain-containing protein n=1 Tax=Fistulifera solaris TaxID=1519565 RepID=A0A1Z5JI31_FISSO|nr:hypothetical protein FisN_3Lh166 [Fistulifera solaris]|eukprot:GAX13596.1 hypothetical protein FisN_3Lh166 [Fistulifera solaris]
MKKYRHLKAFHGAYGHCNLPNSHENEGLSSWIADQRSSYRSGTLRRDHQELLHAMGFVWSPSGTEPSDKGERTADSRWMERYNRLVAYKTKNGHIKVKASEDKDLNTWIYNQRASYHAGTLRKDRKQLLSELEFVWNTSKKVPHSTKVPKVQPTMWMEYYTRLLAFHRKHGHLIVTTKDDKGLNKWIFRQRLFQNFGTLRRDRKELLDQIGFDWVPQKGSSTKSGLPSIADHMDSNLSSKLARGVETQSARIDDRVWNANLQLLSDYKERHGHTDVPRRGKTKELGQWLFVQCSLIERRKLAEDKATRLLDLLKVDTVVEPRSMNRPPADEAPGGSAKSSNSTISWTHESETLEIIQKFPVGTRIEKQFEVEGKFESFGGAVVSFDHFEDDEGSRFWGYMIHYDDGDKEHMLEADVAKHADETKRKKRGRPKKDDTKEATIAKPLAVDEAERKRRSRRSNGDPKSTERQKKEELLKGESCATTYKERKAKAVSVVVATGASEKKESSAHAEKKETANQSSMPAETNDEVSTILQQRSKRKVTLDDFDHNNQVEDFVEGGAVIQVSTENRNMNSESLNKRRQNQTEVENKEKSFDEVDHEDERLASVVSPVTSSAQAIGPKSSTVCYPNQKFAIGTPIVRTFFDMSDNEEEKAYSGKVAEYVYVVEEKLGLYFVQYDDGDTEFLEEWEVAKFSSSLSM